MIAKIPTYEIDLHLEEARKRVKYAEVGPDVDVTVYENDHSEIKIAAPGKWVIKDGAKIFRVSINGADDQEWTREILMDRIRIESLNKSKSQESDFL